MKAPQIVYLALSGISLLLTAHDHGKPRTNTNFWSSAIAAVIMISILWWGGFFH